MIRLDVEQGSGEWFAARLGLPTASCFDKILTSKTLKLSASADGYMHKLLAEQVLGVHLADESSGFMQRGQVMEKRAIGYYELQRDVETAPGGFILRDDRRAGCSPDRFVGDDGLLEIKVPAAATHIGYLLDEEGIGYRLQVQGQLWIAEREWCDTLSYHPDMPPALVRQERDDKVIDALAAAVDQFCNMMEEAKVKLQKLGLFPGFERPLMKVVA
jgi:hypothetical protein